MKLKDLPIGSRVVDPTWEWEFRIGDNYTGTGEVKPVTWIVVAKNHPGYPEDSVTLVTEELIAKHSFDNSTNRGNAYGSNHYGDCGKPNASLGIRKFLNGTAYEGDDGNNYKSFYDTFSEDFKGAILKTVVENKVWNTGARYFTNDRVFIPSQTELGGGNASTHAIGSDYNCYTDNASRIKALAGTITLYWTRSPRSADSYTIHGVNTSGSLSSIGVTNGLCGVLPALNLKSETLVSENLEGSYDLIFNEPPNLSKTQISKTNIWDGETGNIIITTEVSDGEGEDIKYKVIINGVEVKPFSELTPTPTTLTAQVSKNDFELGDNLLKLVVQDASGGESNLEYNIIKENRDTFTFKRVFDFEEDYITDPNLSVTYNEGLGLNITDDSYVSGSVDINIPTEGKSRISKLTIARPGIEETEATTITKSSFVSVLGDGGSFSKKITRGDYKGNIISMKSI